MKLIRLTINWQNYSWTLYAPDMEWRTVADWAMTVLTAASFAAA